MTLPFVGQFLLVIVFISTLCPSKTTVLLNSNEFFYGTFIEDGLLGIVNMYRQRPEYRAPAQKGSETWCVLSATAEQRTQLFVNTFSVSPFQLNQDPSEALDFERRTEKVIQMILAPIRFNKNVQNFNKKNIQFSIQNWFDDKIKLDFQITLSE